MGGGGIRWLAVAAASVACGQSASPGEVNGGAFTDETFECTIPRSWIVDGGPPKDGIPALTNPPLVAASESPPRYLDDNDRVIGVVLDGVPVAVPLNIGWWHEIVNLELGAAHVAITHCPLSGSSLAFDLRAAGDVTFGVSGLLYMNNLVMYDRARDGPASLWPQLLRGARCGPRTGTPLAMVPAWEMRWSGWRSLYPDTRVVSEQTGHRRDYTYYPYPGYNTSEALFFPMPAPVDRRRPAKERVLGVPGGDGGGIAFPYGALDQLGPVAAVAAELAGEPLVVFWDRERRAAGAYRPALDGRTLTFATDGGVLRDEQTGSAWRVDGRATDGPLAGRRLAPLAEAFVAYWFAWAAFHPNATLWAGSAP